jgi:hypothetical protein
MVASRKSRGAQNIELASIRQEVSRDDSLLPKWVPSRLFVERPLPNASEIGVLFPQGCQRAAAKSILLKTASMSSAGTLARDRRLFGLAALWWEDTCATSH